MANRPQPEPTMDTQLFAFMGDICDDRWNGDIDHFDEIFITGCPGSGQFDNFRW